MDYILTDTSQTKRFILQTNVCSTYLSKIVVMWKLVAFFALICTKLCRGAPNIPDVEPDVSTIKRYIEQGQEILQQIDGSIESNNYFLNSEDQKAIKFYNYYHNLANHPISYYSSNGDGDTIICFPNKQCVDLGDIGIYP